MSDQSASPQGAGQRAAPIASRPHMPEGYGIPKDDEGMFTWADLQEPLETTRIYWVATTRPDGRPHAVPIWGAWVDDTFYFEGSPETRRGRNLAANPATVVHLERENLAIMIEGVAEIVGVDAALFERIADSFAARYEYRPSSQEGWCAVRPKVVLAWDKFPSSATRFRFADDG
jgi:hypothetical protein